MEPNAAAEAGHAGVPPPPTGVAAGNVKAPVPTLKTTRWNAVSVPTAAVIVFAAAKVPVTIPVDEVVIKKEFTAGARANTAVATRDGASVGHAAAATVPEPVSAVGAGAVKNRTCPVSKVPTTADTTPFVTPVTGTAVGNVDTRKAFAAGAAEYKAAPANAAAFAGQATVPPPLSVRVLPYGVNKSRVPAASVPTGAVIVWREVLTAVIETLAATVNEPRVVTVTEQMVSQLVALGEIWNVFEPGAHA